MPNTLRSILDSISILMVHKVNFTEGLKQKIYCSREQVLNRFYITMPHHSKMTVKCARTIYIFKRYGHHEYLNSRLTLLCYNVYYCFVISE